MNPRYNCIVPNCQVSSDPTIPKFPFPCDLDLGQKWLNLVCSPILRNIPYREIRARRFKVCAEHFAENTWYPTTVSSSLISGTLPTLKLPDSRNWQPILIRDKEIDLKNLKGETTIDNTFPGEFSSSFTYSDSSSIQNIKDSQLPIRGRGDSLKMEESASEEKNNRRKYKKKAVKREPGVESTSGSDWEVEIVQGVSKRRKKARFELSDDDFESVEETTDLNIERIPCNSDDTEKETDYEGFEEVSSDDSAIETRSIFRYVYAGKGRNNEKIKNETNEKIIEYTFGEAERDSTIETAPILRNLSSKKEASEEKLILYTFGEAKKDTSKETAPRKETDKVKIIKYGFGEDQKDSSIETTPILRKSSRQEESKQRLVKYAFGDAEYDYSVTERVPTLRKSSRQKANVETKKNGNKETRKRENEATIKEENVETRKEENVEAGKKGNREMRKKENEEKKISEYIFGETERAELVDVDREIYDTEKKKIKSQIYKTTLKFKRNNVETGKIVEDVFIIEHTFMSKCRKCPNHENDSVSVIMKKIKSESNI
ncbi:vicilin-like seed storage protein At2g18540 [Belonocnema kinseyi]|uniref:vicilin-like seed storage protein At2g18540 n=1 Tax=Belonocnema kinseyi TaxID=2817044 RepID=UPI00143DF6D6|nr:vicilin-like seed storage protein At2g18540 [Belonocnema kinseyi]